MQIKASNGNDLDTVVLVDANGAPYTPGGGGGGPSAVTVTGNVASATVDSGNPVKVGAIFEKSVPSGITLGNRFNLQLGSTGSLRVELWGVNDAAGAVVLNPTDAQINYSGLMTTNRAQNWNGASWDRVRGDTTGTFVVNKPVSAGGTSTYRVVSAASTNTAFIKATPGQIYGIQLSNSSASWRFVKLYNKASAPVLASDVPVDIVGIPPGGRVEMNRHLGMAFSTGIAIAITAGYADTDTGVTVAGDVVGSIQYF